MYFIDSLSRARQKNVFYKTKEFYFASIYMLQAINLFVSESVKLWNLSTPTMLVYILIYGIVAFSWLFALIKNALPTILTVLGAIALILLSVLINQANTGHILNIRGLSLIDIAESNGFIMFALCMPFLVLAFTKLDLKRLLLYLRNYSLISVICFCMMMFLQVFIFPQVINYMTIAYFALPCIIILYYSGREEKKPLNLILSFSGMFFIFIGGCRGALLTLFVALFIWELLRPEEKRLYKTIGLAFGIILIMVIMFNLGVIAKSLDGFFKSFGYSSRLLKKMIKQDDLLNSLQADNRVDLYSKIFNDLNILGHGVFGDWFLLNTYTHNFLLEVLYDFGIIIGSGLLILVVWFCIASYKNARQDKASLFFWVVFFSLLIIKMMVSSSYLTDSCLWMFFGVCFNIYKSGGADARFY
ncbi:MAG: hypothetical protein IJX88_01805 [Clostridia bacterium]|nr:hypothetical protein [Clostridia bacterium]